MFLVQKQLSQSLFAFVMGFIFAFLLPQGGAAQEMRLAQAKCDYHVGFVEGYVSQVVRIESESLCVAYFKKLEVTRRGSCGLNPDLVATYGLPVKCGTRLGTFIKNYVYYSADYHALWFEGVWYYLPEWPSPVTPDRLRF